MDEVVIRSGRYLKLGAERLEIRDDGRPVHYVDVLLEARHHMSVVILAFASVVWDGDNDKIAQVASRIRLNLAVAQDLHRVLGGLIEDATKPTDKSKAN